MTKNGSSIHKNLFIHVKTYFLYSKKKKNSVDNIFFIKIYLHSDIRRVFFFNLIFLRIITIVLLE